MSDLLDEEKKLTKGRYIAKALGTIFIKGQLDVPLPTYPYGKSLNKPYIMGIYG